MSITEQEGIYTVKGQARQGRAEQGVGERKEARGSWQVMLIQNREELSLNPMLPDSGGQRKRMNTETCGRGSDLLLNTQLI